MIVGGGEFAPGGAGPKLLAQCLASVRPVRFDQMVLADTGISDEALAVIVAESKLREAEGFAAIETPKFAWVGDFAAARNESLKHVTADWMFWLDSDDVLEEPERLRELTAIAPPDVGGLILDYYYAFDETGNCTTLIPRRRLLRMSVGWLWHDRLHEDILHRQETSYERVPSPRIIQQRQGYESRHARNMGILTDWYAKEPERPHIWRHVAYQLFANGEFQKAVPWFVRVAADLRVALPERWQSLCYTSKCFRELKRPVDALNTAQKAIALIPDYSTGWLEVGLAFAAMGEWQKCIWWTVEAQKREMASGFLITNPVEHAIQPYDTLATAYHHTGDIVPALEAARKYAELKPTKEAKFRVEVFESLLRHREQAQGFLSAASRMTPLDIEAFAAKAGLVRQFSKVRDLYAPTILSGRFERGERRTAIFFVGATLTEFTSATVERDGLFGSEMALVHVLRHFRDSGYRVEVFGNPGAEEGIIDDIGWWGYERYREDMAADLLVAWRAPDIGRFKHAARQKWSWLHDLNYGERFTAEHASGLDRVLGVSAWHERYLRWFYPFLRSSQTGFVPNGIDLGRFAEPVAKQKNKFVYSSSPDRGLMQLLEMWHDSIGKQIPDAELHVFYGFKNLTAFPGAESRGQQLEAEIRRLAAKDPARIHLRGKVGQAELAREMLSADFFAYPTAFLEVSCLSAMEAMAAGAAVVTSRCGALPETVGAGGLLVPGLSGSPGYNHRFIGTLLGLAHGDGLKAEWQQKALKRAPALSWQNAFQKWDELCKSVSIP